MIQKISITSTQKIIVLSLLFCLGACSEKPQGSRYFPLQEGLEWTYQVTTEYPNEKKESELSIATIGKETYDGETYFVRRTSSGIDYYHKHDETGTYREGLRTLVELKPRLDLESRYVLKSPLEVVGVRLRDL